MVFLFAIQFDPEFVLHKSWAHMVFLSHVASTRKNTPSFLRSAHVMAFSQRIRSESSSFTRSDWPWFTRSNWLWQLPISRKNQFYWFFSSTAPYVLVTWFPCAFFNWIARLKIFSNQMELQFAINWRTLIRMAPLKTQQNRCALSASGNLSRTLSHTLLLSYLFS